MTTLEYTYWQDGDFFIGHSISFPDYETQGTSKEELVENLVELLSDLESGEVPYVRRVEELVIA
ncbi:MAG: type II toxin-antitoxin system HicB family antitoxin [Acidobacteria bacterium]|nr:type II toxin-antitoxin system HicB family antitoxin [Acidobacteriota bacterium]